MDKKKSGEKMYGKKIVGPKGHVRHAGTTHKRKNASNISHPTGMQAYSGARRNKLQKELEARDDKVRPRKKKVPTIKARPGPTKVKPTKKELKMDRELRLQDMAPNVYNMIEAGQKSKKMGGGKVMYKKHGGKVSKETTSGDDLISSCYD